MSTIADWMRREPAEVANAILELHPEDTGWLDEFAEVLDQRRSGRVLERILDVWGLNQSETAQLFGVSRQAFSKWLRRGVPGERVEAIANLAAATDLLLRHLKRHRIPAVVRRKASELDGDSLLGLAAAGRTRDALDACRSMFDFDRVHR